MHTHRKRSVTILIWMAFILGACNLPRGTPTASGVDAINTAAAETVAARLTQAAQPPPTGAALTLAAPTAAAGETPAAPTPAEGAASPSPGATADEACDQMEFVEDVTYPDGTQVGSGQSFIKTWRLENAGSCPWTTSYAMVFVEGDRMEAPEITPLPATVAPGERVDLSVTLRAPAESGEYRAVFKLRNAAGAQFGDVFYAQIEVPGASGTPGSSASGGFDFVSRAAAATWTSGAGDTLDTNLAFAGADNDPNGLANIKDGVKLETGAVSGKVLLTVPKAVENGTIAGTFPAYTVGAGERLKARLAFMTNADGNCGAGNAIFQVAYKEGDTVEVLEEWEESCNGSATPIDLDLSALRGRTVQFLFIVRANGSPQDDWAVWNSPRIE